MNPIEVVRSFVDRINARDVDGIVALMSPNHRFIDSDGRIYKGRETMKDAWAGYFRFVPDYRVEVKEFFSEGPVVVLLGEAGGTYSPDGAMHDENKWSTPAAWRAQVGGEAIAEWRLYADQEPIRALVRRKSD
jgi:ketosteroid isomerase-like protein